MQVHLIELVNAADAVVREHEGTRLDPNVPIFVPGDRSSEARSAGGLAVGVDAPGDKLVDHLEKLGLGSGGVANNQDVDIAADVDLVLGDLVDSPEQLQQQGLLDLDMPENGREQRVSHVLVQAVILLHFLYLENLLLGQLVEHLPHDHIFIVFLLLAALLLGCFLLLHILFFPELVVLHDQVGGNEDEFVVQLPDALEASHSLHFHRLLAPRVFVARAQGCPLAGFDHA